MTERNFTFWHEGNEVSFQALWEESPAHAWPIEPILTSVRINGETAPIAIDVMDAIWRELRAAPTIIK